jgi:hypothetical protein
MTARNVFLIRPNTINLMRVIHDGLRLLICVDEGQDLPGLAAAPGWHAALLFVGGGMAGSRTIETLLPRACLRSLAFCPHSEPARGFRWRRTI